MKTRKQSIPSPPGRQPKQVKVRSIRTLCGKQGYSSKKVALAKAKASARDTGEDIRAYRCPRGCHAWHLGHHNPNYGD